MVTLSPLSYTIVSASLLSAHFKIFVKVPKFMLNKVLRSQRKWSNPSQHNVNDTYDTCALSIASSLSTNEQQFYLAIGFLSNQKRKIKRNSIKIPRLKITRMPKSLQSKVASFSNSLMASSTLFSTADVTTVCGCVWSFM